MDTVDFPWKNTPAITDDNDTPKEPPNKPPLGIFTLSKLVPALFVILIVGLFLLGQRRAGGEQNITPTIKEVEVLLAIQPVAKNKILHPEILRPALIAAKELSKKQYFERLKQSDLEKLKGKLFLKRDLPIGKPIFWSDVEIRDGETMNSKKPSAIFEVLSPGGGNR